jgi:hypothetical protein
MKLEEYEPAVIAVDHEFTADTSKIGTIELLETASYFGDIIFAYDPLSSGFLEPPGVKGQVIFPAQTSIRYYRNSDSSFAFLLAKRLSPKLKEPKNKNDSFPIHYCSYAKGFTHWQDKIDQYYDINFKAIEAKDFFDNNDSAQIEELKKLVAGKAVIIGHLGSPEMYNSNDIEDKFRVPVDPMAMTGREKIMPGPVIHANAVENFLHPKEMFYELKGFWFIFLQQLLYFFYLAFVLLEKFGSVTKKIALGILSVISFIVVIKLMNWGIYVTMGTTLLQLLIIEEITEMFDPYYTKLENFFKKRKNENV